MLDTPFKQDRIYNIDHSHKSGIKLESKRDCTKNLKNLIN